MIAGLAGRVRSMLAPIEQRLKDLEEAPKAADGVDGKDGRDGRDGRDGVDGKDALDIQVLPSIDEERSYARGTYASHRGGIWVARTKTQGMEGWECIVNGYDSIVVEFDDERTFTVKSMTSDGRTTEKSVELPVVLDRGVYKSGQDYVPGDAATYGGSLWIAQSKTNERPGTGDGWRLAVKRGRDGRDALPKVSTK